MSTYAEVQTLAIKKALAEVGTRETGGTNRGPKIDNWLGRVHLAPGDPWCCAFVWSMVDDACRELGLPNPLPRVGSVAKLWKRAPIEAKSGVAQPGIFCHLENPHDEWSKGHVGFVVSVATGTPGWIETAEGNTNRDGSRDGDSVWCHKRGFEYPVGYINLAALDSHREPFVS